MKRLIGVLLGCLLAPSLLFSQAQPARTDRPIFVKLNLPAQVAATTNYVVVSTLPADGAYTIAHQPDVPRTLTGTITSATINAGTITIVGTDVNGNALTEVWTLTGGGAALTFTGKSLFKTITSITGASEATITGGDTIIMGVGSTVAYEYCSLFDPPQTALGQAKTSGSSTTVTAVTGIGNDTPFSVLGVGDEIYLNGPSITYVGTVTAKASGASITVDTAVNLGTGGTGFMYRTLTCGYDDNAGWQRIYAGKAGINVSVVSATAVGGINWDIEGRKRVGISAPAPPIQLIKGNYSTVYVPGNPAQTSANVWEITDTIAEVRVGLAYGTSGSASQINSVITAEARQ
jgi:hypothetical protein